MKSKSPYSSETRKNCKSTFIIPISLHRKGSQNSYVDDASFRRILSKTKFRSVTSETVSETRQRWFCVPVDSCKELRQNEIDG